MTRITPVNPETANAKTTEILAAVKKKMGKVPNIVGTLANSAATANAYLNFSGALAGTLTPTLRERLALVTGQANDCGYCLAAHTLMGKGVGLSDDQIIAAREGTADDAKEAAAVAFAQNIVQQRGKVEDADVQAVRSAGYGDGEITEIIANVALNLFTNYFNHVTDPVIDFPAAPELATA